MTTEEGGPSEVVCKKNHPMIEAFEQMIHDGLPGFNAVEKRIEFLRTHVELVFWDAGGLANEPMQFWRREVLAYVATRVGIAITLAAVDNWDAARITREITKIFADAGVPDLV